MQNLQNQIINPKKGKPGDPVWKIYFKHDGCSMLLFNKLTRWQATNRADALKKFYSDWKGTFIITK